MTIKELYKIKIEYANKLMEQDATKTNWDCMYEQCKLFLQKAIVMNPTLSNEAINKLCNTPIEVTLNENKNPTETRINGNAVYIPNLIYLEDTTKTTRKVKVFVKDDSWMNFNIDKLTSNIAHDGQKLTKEDKDATNDYIYFILRLFHELNHVICLEEQVLTDENGVQVTDLDSVQQSNNVLLDYYMSGIKTNSTLYDTKNMQILNEISFTHNHIEGMNEWVNYKTILKTFNGSMSVKHMSYIPISNLAGIFDLILPNFCNTFRYNGHKASEQYLMDHPFANNYFSFINEYSETESKIKHLVAELSKIEKDNQQSNYISQRDKLLSSLSDNLTDMKILQQSFTHFLLDTLQDNKTNDQFQISKLPKTQRELLKDNINAFQNMYIWELGQTLPSIIKVPDYVNKLIDDFSNLAKQEISETFASRTQDLFNQKEVSKPTLS